MIRTFEQKEIVRFAAENGDWDTDDIYSAVMESIRYTQPLTDEQLVEKAEYVRELLYNFRRP